MWRPRSREVSARSGTLVSEEEGTVRTEELSGCNGQGPTPTPTFPMHAHTRWEQAERQRERQGELTALAAIVAVSAVRAHAEVLGARANAVETAILAAAVACGRAVVRTNAHSRRGDCKCRTQRKDPQKSHDVLSRRELDTRASFPHSCLEGKCPTFAGVAVGCLAHRWSPFF